MNKYQDGKIYKLTSKQTDKIYVGSTIQTLNARMVVHKYNNDCSSIELKKHGNMCIELIEDYPCNSYIELLEREQYYIDLYKDIIVNQKNATQLCNHNKRRERCQKCNGSQICEHNKLRYRCVECKGSGICEHLNLKQSCFICNNIKRCVTICITSNKQCKWRASADSDYCGRHIPK